jgi:AraC-like DNA-binding protein
MDERPAPIVFARVLEAAREAVMDVSALRELHGHEPWSRRSRARMHDTGDGSRIFEHLPVEGHDLGARCRRELMMASGAKFARDVTELPSGRGACASDTRGRAIGASTRRSSNARCASARDDGLEFDEDTLAIPLPGAGANLSEFLVEHLRALAGDPPAATTLEGRLRQAIGRRIGGETLGMDTLAQELGMSMRALRRRLLEHRTSYHEVLDRVRRELADELFGDDHKISEVAFLLGFFDASAFHRTYVRWTGYTPSSRRREPPAGSG